MPGAGKKRGKIDKKNGSGPAATTEQPPAAEASFDGPPPAGRGRPVDNPIPSGSRDISVAASAAGPLRDPARDAAVFLNRNVDFAGNAYNLINKVSVICSSETVCCPSAGSTCFFVASGLAFVPCSSYLSHGTSQRLTPTIRMQRRLCPVQNSTLLAKGCRSTSIRIKFSSIPTRPYINMTYVDCPQSTASLQAHV